MSSPTLRLRLAMLLSLAAVSMAAAYGCSGGDNSGNPGPSNHDGGGDSTASSSGSGSSSGSDASGSSSGSDAQVIDTGSCTSDASTCNSCYSSSQAAQDPLNACAPETVNCIPFTKTVPSHPTL